MKNIPVLWLCLSLLGLTLLISCVHKPEGKGVTIITSEQMATITQDLVETHGEAHRARIEKGVAQTAAYWRKSDGTADDFFAFCRGHFISDPRQLKETALRFETNLESIDGHLHEIRRDLHEPMDLDRGPMLPADHQFVQFNLASHVNEDFFKTKIAFTALLNFPLYTLNERLTRGESWTRDEWARARLVQRFSTRIPPEAAQYRTNAYTRADNYISNYNIHMHHVLTDDGRRPFPKGMALITHWNLRDELKSRYADPDGLFKQEMIFTIMERIITQDIPEVVIDNPTVDWVLESNEVKASPIKYEGLSAPETITNNREPDTRYRHLLATFKAEQALDPYFPAMPTKIERRFQRDREIPEATVEKLFTDLLTSDEFKATGQLIQKRLGRPLRPFDIWYKGFRAKSSHQESDLDRIVSRKYPDPNAFERDIPRILRQLGFSRKMAQDLASHVAVDPARGAGHAMGAARREDKAHLRTRIAKGGMNYKGYNIAVHELGHNIEQVLSLTYIDHTLLNGVPNTAFTEAFAFVFQARDLDLLGISTQDESKKHLDALNNLWATCEIAGVSLVDMRVWRWMYQNPDATPAELKEAVLSIAKNVWNEFYAPVFGSEDEIILAIYSHMIDAGMYLPDYPLGHIIAFQIERYLEGKNLGTEMERMCTLGSITPDAWMQQALGQPISVAPMLEAAGEALKIVK